MGLIWSVMSYVWPSAAPSSLDQVDPVTGLSQREKQDVRQIWDLVSQDLEGAGIGFFTA